MSPHSNSDPETTPESRMKKADLVIVANRLPVDRVVNTLSADDLLAWTGSHA